MSNRDLRRRATLAVPVVVPLTMTGIFALLRRRLSPRAAYATGFGLYWLGWCAVFPLWVLGRRGVLAALASGRRPRPVEVALLAFPVAGALGSELLPRRHQIDRQAATVMVATAAVNAVGEELLWRGLFRAEFPGDLARGALWPLAGFTIWHLAPQQVLPSSRGRLGFLLGAAVVGATSTIAAERSGGLRSVLLAHLLTDACGVRPARFLLGR